MLSTLIIILLFTDSHIDNRLAFRRQMAFEIGRSLADPETVPEVGCLQRLKYPRGRLCSWDLKAIIYNNNISIITRPVLNQITITRSLSSNVCTINYIII